MAQTAPSETKPRPLLQELSLPLAAARLAIFLSVFLAYANSLSVPFLFDDLTAIKENESIRSLWPLSGPLDPPRGGGETVEGRPLVNLSFALNYAAGGLDPRGYHLANVLIHAAAAVVLFGLLRRAFSLPSVARNLQQHASAIAFATALLWALHPLQTAAVTYLSRRADSLLGLFYLLALYCLLRGAATASRNRHYWYAGSVIACYFGMGTKETMISAPLIAFLFDRTFLAGASREAWRRRWPLYIGMATSWILLAFLIANAGTRGGTAGFGIGVSPLDYAMTQGHAILLYLRLSVWPQPLVFDYGMALPELDGWLILQAVFVGGLAIGSLWALWRRPRAGFVLVCFFALLAPSSSFVPIATQPIAEHRMYLPLAALAALVSLATYRWIGNKTLPTLAVLAIVLGFMTASRNAAYQSAETLWSDTVVKRPENARAHNILGAELAYQGRFAQALPHFEAAVQLDDDNATAHANIASCLVELGKDREALPHFAAAINGLNAKPTSQTLYSYAAALHRSGRSAEGESMLLTTVKVDPGHFDAHMMLGASLSERRQLDAAAAHFQRAIEIDPQSEAALTNHGNALLLSGKTQDAIKSYQRALQINPRAPATLTNLGIAHLILNRPESARANFQAALQADPSYLPAKQQLARLRQTDP